MAISKVGGGGGTSVTDVIGRMDAEIAQLAEQISAKSGKKVDPEQLVSKLGLESLPGGFWKKDSDADSDSDSSTSSGIVDDDWGAIAARLSARTGQSFTGADLLERFGKEGAGALGELEQKSGRASMRSGLEAQMKALRMRSR